MRFSCLRCGLCCKSEENENSIGIRLFDFEARNIRKNAEQITLKPTLTLSDKRAEKEFIILYGLDSKECPFFQDDSCIIYEDRPIVCRAFPIITTGQFSNGEIVRSGSCRGNRIIKDGLKDAKDIREVVNVYGDCYLYCALFEGILKRIRDKIDEMVKNGKIAPERIKGKYELAGISEYFKGIIDINDTLEEIKTLDKTRKSLGLD